MGQSPKQMWDSPCWSALGFLPLLLCPESTLRKKVLLSSSAAGSITEEGRMGRVKVNQVARHAGFRTVKAIGTNRSE